MRVECPSCHRPREVKWKPKKGTVCFECRNEKSRINPIGERTKYKRVCKCGDVATVGYKPKGGEMCRLCRGREQAKDMCGKNVKREEDKKRYTHICAMCPSVRITVDGRKSNLCKDCSRKHARKKKPYIYFDMETMTMKVPKRYFSYCDKCDDIREVTQSQFSQYGYDTNCRKHAKRTKTYKKSAMQTAKQYTSKDKKVSKAAIEKAIQINRKHKEYHNSEANAKPKQILTNEQMMAQYLSKKKVTVIPDVIRLEDLGVGMKTGFCRGD